MKNNAKWFMAGAVVSLTITCLSTAFSDSVQKTITAVYNNIKIVVDGAQIIPKDAAGNKVEPFTYNDTTYLPVRAVSEALGKDVSWDEETKTVYIGENIPVEEVTVSNAEEFVNAIGSNKKIILKSGEYDLTAISKKMPTSDKVYWEQVYDGYKLVVNEVKNLTIEGPADAVAEIKTEPRYAEVLTFNNSVNIIVKNIKAGHVPKPYECDAGVVEFNNCKNATVENCYIYGCGSIGMSARDCNIVNVKNSTITDCSLRAISLYKSSNVTVSGSKFTDNRAYADIFDIYSCRDVTFEDCIVSGNKMLETGILEAYGSSVVFDKCIFEDNSVAENYTESVYMFVSDTGSTTLKDCTIKSNKFTGLASSDYITFDNCKNENNTFK